MINVYHTYLLYTMCYLYMDTWLYMYICFSCFRIFCVQNEHANTKMTFRTIKTISLFMYWIVLYFRPEFANWYVKMKHELLLQFDIACITEHHVQFKELESIILLVPFYPARSLSVSHFSMFSSQSKCMATRYMCNYWKQNCRHL